MDDKVKAKILVSGIDALFTHGLPAMAKLISTLNDKNVTTIEDIEAVKGELDAASYFDD